MLRSLRRLRARVQSRLEGRSGTVFTMEHDDVGLRLSWLTLENDTGHAELQWASVQRVVAYKRDLYAVDLICLLFVLDADHAVEVDEEMAGWDSLVAHLPARLPGITPFSEWWHSVAVPAFAANERVLFHRSTVPAV